MSRKPTPRHKPAAVILSGGGARGAYEAGVIRYMLEKLPERTRAKVQFDILAGTSVGAIHACFLAATADDPQGQGKRLEAVWAGLHFDSVYSFGAGQLWNVLKWNLGLSGRKALKKGLLPRRMGGFLDTKPLERVVIKAIPWRNITRNIESGKVRALSVSATELKTGYTVVFVENSGPLPPWSVNPYMKVKKTRLMPSHALASASIPLLFPSVMIDGRFYCDGGLRQNTPLSPALRLGAEKVLIIGLHHQPKSHQEAGGRRGEMTDAPTHPGYLLGKVLNAFLLDHVDYDISRLRMFNAVMEQGQTAFGKGFIDRLNRIVEPVRGAPYQVVRNVLIRPSDDIGSIAAKYAKKTSAFQLRHVVDWGLRHALRMGTGRREADLLSYLLFDGDYSRALMKLGMADAEKIRGELIDFFES